MSRIGKTIVALLVASLLIIEPFSVTEAGSTVEFDAEGLYARAEAAIFYVRAFRPDGTLQDVGTGFLVKPDGTALTAYHVVEGADQISCMLNDASIVACRITGMDEEADTAVLKLPPPADSTANGGVYPYLPLRTTPVKHGEKVYAVGYPMKGTKIITEGVVNAPRAPINGRDRMLVSAELVNGMSGGPVLDRFGYAAGLASGSLRTMSGIHLAVDTATLQDVVRQGKR